MNSSFPCHNRIFVSSAPKTIFVFENASSTLLLNLMPMNIISICTVSDLFHA